MLLLAVVRIEPAPSDLVFAVVIAVALVTGRLFLERVPLSVSVLVAGFLALNLLAATVATDGARAVAYFAITLYLGVFALWFSAYVCSVRRARLILLAYLVGAALSAAVACLALVAPFPAPPRSWTAPARRACSRIPTSSGRFSSPPP